MGRPRVHDEASGNRLLALAADLMHVEGRAALSVRRVAEEAGTSHRAVYALFGSKQGLLNALAAFGYQKLSARVSSLEPTTDPVADLVRAGVNGFRGFALSRPALFRLTFEDISAEALQQPRVVEAALASYSALADWVARLRVAGLIHPDRSDGDCCFSFHAACQGLAGCELAALQPPDGPGFWRNLGPDDFDRAWVDTLDSVVRGFARPPVARRR